MIIFLERKLMASLDAYYRKEHAQEPVIVASEEAVDVLIDELMSGPVDHNLAQVHSLDRPLLPSGFPDHEVMVGASAGRNIGIIAFVDGGVGNIFSVGMPDTEPATAYFLAGHPMEYPENCEVPIALVREALKEFLLTGGNVPTCVDWKRSDLW
ncbi:Imm1 family immunity protein [Streptomyces sp. NPDC004539]|uniref:Imm1 family immunity protein n=1 Tax=Streptomyces sp. NPDC004539 TaxID=3154280 RepID=UPI0033BC1369